MKEFHIISSGVSVITNAQRQGYFPKEVKISDEDYWRKFLDNPSEINKIKEFVSSDPFKNSAELNTFLRVVEGKDPKTIEVYLFGTKTSVSELCRRVLENYLKEKGYAIYTPYEVSGYFWEAQYDESYAADEFKKGVAELLDRLITLAKKKINEGYKVYFNPTGGLKAHVIATALAGFLVDTEVYYMNEEFNKVVFLPKLYYLPKGKEINLLNSLSQSSYVSGRDAQEMINQFPNETERLQVYGLIDVEKDEYDNVYRIKINHKGKLFSQIFSRKNEVEKNDVKQK
jgi:putative CRISPR-associated protein (TIGR02619 family)